MLVPVTFTVFSISGLGSIGTGFMNSACCPWSVSHCWFQVAHYAGGGAFSVPCLGYQFFNSIQLSPTWGIDFCHLPPAHQGCPVCSPRTCWQAKLFARYLPFIGYWPLQWVSPSGYVYVCSVSYFANVACPGRSDSILLFTQDTSEIELSLLLSNLSMSKKLTKISFFNTAKKWRRF